jgi:Tol biopolymer transport system component
MIDSTAEQSVSHEAIQAQVKRILASPEFSSSERLSRLFEYFVDQYLSDPEKSISQYQIGFDVFERDTDFDPQVDSVVRVQTGRLRQKLEKYYAGTGLTDEVFIEIRRGCYAANVIRRPMPGHASNLSMPMETSAPEVKEDRSTRRSNLFLFCLCLVGTGIFAGTIFRFSRREVRQPETWTAEPFSALGGQEEFVAISPDGQQLAFSWTRQLAARSQIYLQGLNEHMPKRLTSGEDEESRPVWSPDGHSIAFLRLIAPGKTEVVVKSLSDGTEQKIADLRGYYPWLCSIPRLSWSPDGTRIFASETVGAGEVCSVVAINVATRSLQLITQPPPGSVGDLEAAVSPDGSQLAFLRNAGTLGGDIYVTSVEGGAVRRITRDKRDIMGFCWKSDGSGFIISSRRGDGVPRLWEISLDGKVEKPLTDGLTLAAFPSMSLQGNRVAFTTYHTTASIWQVLNGSEKLLISDQSSNSTPQVSPDGRSLLYRSDRTGSFELWMSKLDGQSGVRLTDFKGPMVNNPRWSPDGTRIAFECRPEAQSNICLVSSSHPGEIHMLNQWTSNEIFPSWSSDGKSIYFTSNHSGQWEIYQQALAGGDPIAITHDGGMRALQSADGRWLYIFRREGSGEGEIVRLPAQHQSDRSIPATGPRIILSGFGHDTLGKWDVDREGLMYLTPSADGKERVTAIDGDTLVHQNVGVVDGPSPPGDLIFSAINNKSFVYVKQGLKEGSIGFLVLESQH